MDPNPYGDVTKTTPSAFYGALSGSVCFPMPLMYNPMNSYPFMSAPFLPMHHPMLSQHGLQDSNHLLGNGDLVAPTQLSKSDDLGTRALAYLRYQSMGKCFMPPRKGMGKFCLSPPNTDCGKLQQGYLQGSLDSDIGGPLTTTTTSPSSVTYTEKECYLSSPSTEVEEPDSSGKCSTDVLEQKVMPRWSCDSSQPPMCPICGRTISLQDLTDHYHMELDKFHDLMRKKEWVNQEENNAEQMDPLRLQSYQDVEKRCPEFRKETYLRVRANRMNRLGGCGSRSKRQCFEDSKHAWKIHRSRQICSPKHETTSDESSAQSAHQSMLMLELTVQQLAHRAEARSDLVSENFPSENRNIPMYQGPMLTSSDGYHDDINKTSELADSSCNGFNNLESCQSSNYSVEALRRRNDSLSDDKPCSSVDVKCLVCMESYKKPVVSVCCWHVHCETCWLKSLGNKRVCPQCETITAPTDLRRIHL